jgi:hypothetical protein
MKTNWKRENRIPVLIMWLSKSHMEYNVEEALKWLKVKVKVKFTLEQATKAKRGRRGIALLFL